MPSIDQRIVSMVFENAKFEANVKTTMATLSKLNASLQLTGAAKGLQDIEAASNKVTLTGASSAADKLKGQMEFSGAVAGLQGIESAANKITLGGAGAAADGMKSRFQTATDDSKSRLDKLKEKLTFPGAAAGFAAITTAASRVNFTPLTTAIERIKGMFGFGNAADRAFSNIESSASRVHLAGISNAISEVSNGFSILQGAAAVALGNIVAKAAQAGASLIKSLTLGPITQGFQEYATNLNSIQTILANTQTSGGNLQSVNAALQDLNKYSDQTIYNFGEMARNIGTFTAAGVHLGAATESIKGIANLAALSGSNSEQASTAMYQLSQAIAAGKVSLQDWNSVVNAGMGGEVFQKALFDTAKAMGTLKSVPVGQTFEEWKKAGNSFRQSLSATQKEASSGTSALKKAQTDAAKTVSDAQTSAADAVEQASQRVKDAEKGVGDAARQGAQDVSDAVRAQSATVKQSAEDVKSALDGVREARKRLVEAMKPPSKDELQAAADSLKTAQLDQADLSTAVSDAQIEQKRSAEDLTTAQQHLIDVQSSGGSAAEIQAAQRAVQDAQKRVADAADAQTRALLRQRGATRDVNSAENDLQTTREKGTKKDANVKTAQDALTAALTKYKDAQVKGQQDIIAAEGHVTDAKRKSADSQRQAGQHLADAEKEQAKTIVDSQKSVADAHTKAAEQIKSATGSISANGPPSWLTSDVLTSTLSQFTGDMTTAQLKAKGFTDEQIKAIQQTAGTAKDAATKVKTLGQVFSVAKETIGSGWASTFQTIFGNFGEARGTFTDLSNTINGFINTNSKARNAVLKDWKALGGRTVLIDGIKKAFEALGAILKPIHDAFREIFPAKTGKDLYDLTVRFRDLMANLKIGPETADNLKRTFAGFFAILDIGKHVVGVIFSAIGKLLGVAGTGAGGFLTFTAAIGDFFVAIDEAVKSGKGFSAFFENLPGLLSAPLELLGTIASALGHLFGLKSGDTSGATSGIGRLHDALTPLQKILDFINGAWDNFMTSMHALGDKLGPVIDFLAGKFASFGDAVSKTFRNINYSDVIQIIQTTLVAGIFVAIKKLFGQGLSVDLGGGLISKLGKTLDGLTSSLKTMQTSVKATTLLEIAAAIGILAAGITVLSMIEPKKLASAMTAIAVGLGQLVAVMAILAKVGGGGAFLTLPIIAAAMIELALAVDILSIAVIAMSKLSWEELAKGLTGVAGVLMAVGLGVKAIPPSIILVGPALIPLAIGINLLAVAVKVFASMKWEDIAKGLLAIGGALTVIGLGMKFVSGPEMLLAGPGLLLVAIGLTALSVAIAAFGGMSIGKLAKGLVGIAAALIVIGLAITAIPPTMALQAAGLLLVAIALTGIAAAVGLMGGMKTETIVKGLLGIGGALVVLALGLTAMSGTLAGSAGLLLAATGLAILVPVLAILGVLPWKVIGKGLAVIAASMLVIGLAGTLAAPGLTAVGVGLAVLGIGLLAAGSGVYLIAKAFSIMGDTGVKGVAAMVLAITAFVAVLPKIIIDFIKGLVSVVKAIADIAPLIVDSLVKILRSLIDVVLKSGPSFALAIGALIDIFLTVIVAKAPAIVAAGATLLLGLLSGIQGNIAQVVTTVGSIIVTFLDSMAAQLPAIVEAGVNTLVTFLKAITDGAPRVIATVVTLLGTIIDSIAAGLPRIIASGFRMLVAFLKGISDHIQSAIDAGGTIIVKIIEGIANQRNKVLKAAVKVIGDFLEACAQAMLDLTRKIARVVINFLNGLADAINENSHAINQAGLNVATALINGLIDGLSQLADKLNFVVGGVVKGMLKKVLGLLGIHSPSSVFHDIGANSMIGMANGISSGGASVISSVQDTGDNILDTMKNVLKPLPEILALSIDTDPVITPVLDLTHIKSGASEIGALIPSSAILDLAPMTAEAAKRASDLSVAMTANGSQSDTPDPAKDGSSPTDGVSFVQNNYSPEALSHTEIYRQTNNQLAAAKKALVGG